MEIFFFSKYFQNNTPNTQTWVSHSRFRANEPKLNTKYDLSHRLLRKMKMYCRITILYYKFGIQQKVQTPPPHHPLNRRRMADSMALGDYKYILDSRPTGASPNVKNKPCWDNNDLSLGK